MCHRSCVYKKRGCLTVSRQELVQRHEKRCLYKPVFCPSDMCSWNDSMVLLTQHIYEVSWIKFEFDGIRSISMEFDFSITAMRLKIEISTFTLWIANF